MKGLKPLLSLTLAASGALAAGAYTVWNDGQGLTYHLFSNGEAALYSVAANTREVTIPASITVDGTEYPVTEWGECDLSRVQKLVIEMPLTEIPGNRFYNHKNLKSVTLPATLTTIGDYAFYNTRISSVEFPKALTSIGSYAFANSSLNFLNVPAEVTAVGSHAFSGTPVEMVSYNAASAAISPDLFEGCANLRVLHLGENVASVGKGDATYKEGNGWQWQNYLECEEAFKDSPLTDVYIDNTTPPAWYTDWELESQYIFSGAIMTATDKDITLHIPASAAEQYGSYAFDLGSIYQTQPPYDYNRNLKLTPYSPSAKNARFKRIEGLEGGIIAPETITIAGPNVITTTTPGQLTAEFLPANANLRQLIWSSDNTSIATVDENGRITGIEVGTANIYAESPFSGAKSEPFRVTVASISPTDFTLDRYADPLVIGIGGEYTLTPAYKPEICSEGLLFTSSDTDIATVDANGTVKAIRRGNCVITGTAIFGGETRTLNVTVVPTATELVINPIEGKLTAAGATIQLSAEVRPEASSKEVVMWSVDGDADSFTISRDGLLTPLKHGYGYGVARTPDGLEARVWVDVDYATAERIIMPKSVTLDHLEIAKIETSVEPALADQTVVLSSDNPGIVQVNYNGDIIGLAAGEATITATDASGNVTASMKVTVNPCGEYAVNLSASEMRFDSDLNNITGEQPYASVCTKPGLPLHSSMDESEIGSNLKYGYSLSVLGTEPAEYGEKLAAAASAYFFPGYSEVGFSATIGEVPRYWSISDESVAQIYPIITNFYDYYHGTIYYAPYAKEIAVIPVGKGSATITYDPEDGSGVTATCLISVGSTVGLDDTGAEAGITIATRGGRILATNPSRKEIAVYTASGTLVARGDSESFATPALTPGIYLVATPEGTTKVAL